MAGATWNYCLFRASSVFTIQPCHFMQSHIRKVYACLAVTCHLHLTMLHCHWPHSNDDCPFLCITWSSRSRISLKVMPVSSTILVSSSQFWNAANNTVSLLQCCTVPCGNFGSPYLGKAQQLQEQRCSIPISVSSIFTCLNNAMATSVWDF